MQGLNINILSYNLPREYIKASDTSVCIETSPEGNSSSISFPTSQVPNSSSFFSINVMTLGETDNHLFQNHTEKIIITIGSKYKIKRDEMLAIGYIYPEDFPSNLGDQNSIIVNLYRPPKAQGKKKKAKSLGSTTEMGVMGLKESEKKIIGSLKVQLTSSRPYYELNQKASWSVIHRNHESRKPQKTESKEKDLNKSKHTFKTKNRENEVYNQIIWNLESMLNVSKDNIIDIWINIRPFIFSIFQFYSIYFY